jgi:nitrate/TMAO reductase-like tetraheme cytochrome c subunit
MHELPPVSKVQNKVKESRRATKQHMQRVMKLAVGKDEMCANCHLLEKDDPTGNSFDAARVTKSSTALVNASKNIE